MTSTSTRLSFIAAVAIASGACTWGLAQKVDYRLLSLGNLPLGTSAVDGSAAFAERFCRTLRHLDPTNNEWGACTTWMETPVADQPPETEQIPKKYAVLVVAGIFAQCFQSQGLHVFQQGLHHLTDQHGLVTYEVVVSGAGSSEANAAQIDEFLRSHNEDFIAVGYSKGISDLMVAIQKYPSAQQRIKVLVSVAGTVGGSRLADLPPPEALATFEKVIKDSGLGRCEIKDAGGLRSLRREERYKFLRTWKAPDGMRALSVVGVVPRAKTSRVLQVLWDRVNYYSLDEDSQVIAEEGIIPGATFLGVALGDHWAVALPFWEMDNPDTRKAVDQNKFPRTALLEAIVREATK